MIQLKVCSLSARLGGKMIFSEVDFISTGKLTALLGRNGCGKSTLLRAMLSLIPSGGNVYIDGTDIRKLNTRERAKLISYLPQHQTLPAGTSVLDYVSLGSGRLFSFPDRKETERALAELERLGLAELTGRYVDTLSGGEARLIGLARARMQNCRVMLLDEPLAGLDFTRQHEFMRQISKDPEHVFMSMHDPMLAWQYADQILLMHNGKVISCDKQDEAGCQKILNEIYGAGIRFENIAGSRLPIWHD